MLTQCHRLKRGKQLATQPLESACPLTSEQPGPAALAEQREAHADLWRAILALPESQRMTTILVYVDGYSQQEVATFLNISVDTVKKRLERARKQLRQQMIEHARGIEPERMIEQMTETLHQQRPSRNERFVRTFQLITMLENAALEGQQATIELLLLDGTDVNTVGSDGQTLLHWAAQTGHTEAVELLIQHKADQSLQDKNGKTPLQLAIEGNHATISKLLMG